MTIEQVVEALPGELEAITDEQWLIFFKDSLDVTRPERVAERKPKQEQQLIYIPPAKAAALRMLEEQGVDLSYLKKKFRTK